MNLALYILRGEIFTSLAVALRARLVRLGLFVEFVALLLVDYLGD